MSNYDITALIPLHYIPRIRAYDRDIIARNAQSNRPLGIALNGYSPVLPVVDNLSDYVKACDDYDIVNVHLRAIASRIIAAAIPAAL